MTPEELIEMRALLHNRGDDNRLVVVLRHAVVDLCDQWMAERKEWVEWSKREIRGKLAAAEERAEKAEAGCSDVLLKYERAHDMREEAETERDTLRTRLAEVESILRARLYECAKAHDVTRAELEECKAERDKLRAHLCETAGERIKRLETELEECRRERDDLKRLDRLHDAEACEAKLGELREEIAGLVKLEDTALADNRALRTALTWYADKKNYRDGSGRRLNNQSLVDVDEGSKARAALEARPQLCPCPSCGGTSDHTPWCHLECLRRDTALKAKLSAEPQPCVGCRKLRKALEEMAATESHAGAVCGRCHSRPGRASQLYGMIHAALAIDAPGEPRQ